MPKKSKCQFDLCDQEQQSEDALTQCLKSSFANNVFYSKISDSALLTINPNKSLPQQSLSYVAEYKDAGANLSGPLPTHIYKLTNQAYLHMRRTGIDQSILLCGESGSGKTENLKLVLEHLVHLSSHKKETKLQSQITNSQLILESFGNARTTCNDNASRFGKYVELQFNERGRMTGAKILNYLLDKHRLTQCPTQEQTFHIFYQIFAGASAEEKTILQLNDDVSYRYIPRRMAASGKEGHHFMELKQAMKSLGISKKYQARICQFIACLLHLGQLEFADDSTLQEAAFVKNTDVLDICADFLGVDPRALENLMTYKTLVIKKDMTTVILNSLDAAKQRDSIARDLYSLLFSWLVEYMNKKLCASTTHNFVGILDFPGPCLHTHNNFHAFCVNLANERIHHFCQRVIFENDSEEYRAEGLSVMDVPYFSNLACVELLTRPSNGLADVADRHAKSSSTAIEMVKDFFSSNPGHASLSHKDTHMFAVQHFAGQVAYNPDDFAESNKDVLNTELVQLIRGSEHTPASFNNFVVELFVNISTEHHPKQADALVSAQQPSGPLRGPSMRRSKSTKRNRSEPFPEKEVYAKRHISFVLSQLNQSLNDVLATLEETFPWFVFCIKPNNTTTPNQLDSQKVRAQIRAWGIPQVCERLKTGYTVTYLYDEFLERYAKQLENIDKSMDAKTQCQTAIHRFGWNSTQAQLGSSKIFLKEASWEELEGKLRILEKEEQRKQKDERRYAENMTSLTAPMINVEREQSFDNLSHASFGSNSEFFPPGSNDYGYNNLQTPRVLGSVYTDDQRSFLSDNDERHRLQSYENESQFGSEIYGQVNPEMKGMVPTAVVEEEAPEDEEQMTRVRRHWLNFVWFMTWWIPTFFLIKCGKMKRADIRIAWREKMTLCSIIFLTSGFIIWFLVFFGSLVCPHQNVYSTSELQSHSDKESAYVAIRGEVFDLTKFAPHHWAAQVIPQDSILDYGGKDASNLFPVQVSALCQGITGQVNPYVSLDFNINLTDTNAKYHNFLPSTDDPRPDWYFEKMMYMRKNYKLGDMGYTPKEVKTQAENTMEISGVHTSRTWVIMNNNIYDLTLYVLGGRRFDLPAGQSNPASSELNFLDNSVVTLFTQRAGQDISSEWKALPLDADVKHRQEVCLRNLYYVGTIDQRNSVRCLFAEYLLLIVTVFLCLIIVFKFLAALQFGTHRDPEKHEKFVICQIPCYTESEEELRKTIDSIASLQYDDKRKLLFIICDGMIIGGGNDRPTPRIVLDILGVEQRVDPEALSFFSVGEGQKQHNMAKIYSGLYESRGHVVPYIVVAKVGKPSERQKPGNRGKRDSQLVLMSFLNKVHFNSPMTPMELELYHQIKNVIGVNPGFYEYVMMVDADTEVMPDGLNRLVSVFTHDAKIIGLCGETVLSNEKDSWVTMIQVYEYYISHYLIKAFESLFGSVTCLPGCFCMYRIRSPQKNQPLLISNQIIEDYAINKVDTLHKKNLLHLGEDRYLTTLILKHFPTYKTKFVSDAKCATNAPDQWSVLLSQRRRWINSTIHNLGELVFLPQLCGFCCFSMRFVVMLDLLSTLVQPAIVGYLVYLIYSLATSTSGVPVMSIITIAGVYGLQAAIFLLRRKWEHIAWMIVSIFAIPVFSFAIPIYSYWHFDDFSWGNTRVVMGDKGKKLVMAAEGKFDRKSIPLLTWEEYERTMFEGLNNAHFDDAASVGSHRSEYSQSSYYSQKSKHSNPFQPSRVASPAFNHNTSSVINPSLMGYTPHRSQSPFH